ncbi:MAG TPA: alpha/beta hydrolase [Candidatus Saccharimonadales bacterium]|nr:alpha/beta hydrolase [Candidatus Saccharimonadales bacterium]
MMSSKPEYVASADGTKIGYYTYGSGPGIVLIQGAAGTAYHFYELAEALSDSFTVHLPDRRGRGLSPRSYSDDYTIQRDIEDLDAVLKKTGAHFVYGLSSGGIIALQATLKLPAIQKLAVYEPAIFVNGLPLKALTRFDKQMAKGKLASAMVTAMKAAQMGPPILRYIPNWLLAATVQLLMNQEAKKGSGEYPPTKELALAMPYDFTVVRSVNDKIQFYKSINRPVLLLGGSRSPAYLKAGLNKLKRIIPKAEYVELIGSDHASSWNYDRRRNPNGNPRLVAEKLREFFSKT